MSGQLRIRSVLVVAVVMVTQLHAESARWWMSVPVASSIGLSAEQAADIERRYESTLPARRLVSQQIIDLTRRASKLLHDYEYGDELQHVAEQLVQARKEQMDLRRRMIEMTAGVLTCDQRASLARLRPASAAME